MSLAETRKRYDDWLAARDARPADIMSGIRDARHLPLDKAGLKARGWTDLPIDWVPEDGHVHVGGYGEDRAIYDTPIFNPPGAEPRTIHLGLDVFAPAGRTVYAPLAGTVHSVQVNDNAKDYGPTIILQHEPSPDLTIWSLYGHLSRDSLDGLASGAPVAEGQEIGRLGANDVNGGWAPHLHFQIILDMLGQSGDFPGVCKRSEAEYWLTLCPDPAGFIGAANPG